jgi:hypothetical protein
MIAGIVVALAAIVGLTSSGALAAGRSSARVTARSSVVVILKNQNRGLPARSAARTAAVASEQAPIISTLHSAGASDVAPSGLVNSVAATVSPSTVTSLEHNPAVAEVIPDSLIHEAIPVTDGAGAGASPADASPADVAAPPCGTPDSPELDPEALNNINALAAQNLGYNGAGITVAYIADGIDPTVADFQRNPQFASAGSPAGSPVITDSEDFSNDGTAANQTGTEAFLDASSIAAQGNTEFDLSTDNHNLPTGCDIKIEGDAPGADVMGLKVFGNGVATTSSFLQSIGYAVDHGVKVLNESFGNNGIPQTSVDAIEQANDAAVAAGVTVVVSSGDAGPTNTLQSPAADPNVISAGASTSFRARVQDGASGTSAPGHNGLFADDNLSAFSSSGFGQNGTTLDLVAPGDENWDLQGAGFRRAGGTSEAAPLIAGAAADMIEAYSESHDGSDPTPAQIKQVLMSTAKDIDAPAQEQGAGLLDIGAAVKMARSLPGTTMVPDGGVMVGPGEINVTQQANTTSTQSVTVTNTGSSPAKITLATRAFRQISQQTGSFCMQPGSPTADCPANTGTFTDGPRPAVYQAIHFDVTKKNRRVVFDAAGPDNGDLLLVLLEPDGTYAGYSAEQGNANHAHAEVADAPLGTWTAIVYTEFFFSGDASGTVHWGVSQLGPVSAGKITPSKLTLAAGQTSTAQLTVNSPATAGDAARSVVVTSPTGQTTLPVAVRTLVPIKHSVGTFAGKLTGGNGRQGGPAQVNTYSFDVPDGTPGISVGLKLKDDPGDRVIAHLVSPDGDDIGYDSNSDTISGSAVNATNLSLYAKDPVAGRWQVVLDWVTPVSGQELVEPFNGTITLKGIAATGNLPDDAGTTLTAGVAHTFTVTLENTSKQALHFFADPRLATTQNLRLIDFGSPEGSMTLPTNGNVPVYLVPPHTTQLDASQTSSVPSTFDLAYVGGDPDIAPADSSIAVPGPGGDTSSLSFTEPEIAPGLWVLTPDLIGPFGASPPAHSTASAQATVVTQAFDPTVTSSTGDLWQTGGAAVGPAVAHGQTKTITITITPTGAPGSVQSGTVDLDDFTQSAFAAAHGDVVASMPYEYTVG